MDSVIRTYDVPTGQLVDAFRCSSIATGVTFSPTGDFLATSHVDSVGVHLWANKAQFIEVALKHIDEDQVTDAAMPTVQGTDDTTGEYFFPNSSTHYADDRIPPRYRTHSTHWGARVSGHLHYTRTTRRRSLDTFVDASVEVADAPEPRCNQSEF